MKKGILFTLFLMSAACSNLSDLISFNATVASIAIRSPIVHHAVIHNSAHTAGTGTSTGATVTAGVAATIAVQVPSSVDNGDAIPVTITGLNLHKGESARLYADNCEMMEIVNYGDATIKTLTTLVKLKPKDNIGAIIRVESIGRDAKSNPIQVSAGGETCNPGYGFTTANDVDFGDFGSKLKTETETTSLIGSKKNGITQVSMKISHPMENGKNKSAHYITNIGLMENNKELVAIKTTPVLSQNPQIDLELENTSSKDELTLAWLDNKDQLGKNSQTIH